MNTKLLLPEPDLAHERYNAMLRFVARNQIATNDALNRTVVPEVAAATAQKMISKLIKRGLLKRWKLHASKSYLRLGPSAIARWRYPASLSRRLGPQVLPYLLGCLSLTTYSQPPLKRLLTQELEATFPGFPVGRDLLQWAYYRETQVGLDSLVTIRVEYRVGGDAVINKLSEQIHRYRQHECIAALLESRRFHVHVVTATAEQEQALHSSANRLGFTVPLRTCHDPSLTCFL